jgi:PAS domain S-box-containing protein
MPNPTQDVLWLRNRALDSTQLGVSIADARAHDLPLINVNIAFHLLTGYEQTEVLGLNCRFLQGPRTDKRVAALIGNAIQHSEQSRVVILNYRKDGSPFWNEVNVSPVYDSAGTLTHYVGTQTDVSERIRNDQYRQLLNDIESAMARSQDLEIVGKDVAKLVVQQVADVCAIHLKGDDGEIRLAATDISDSIGEFPELQNSIESHLTSDVVPEAVRDCIESGQRAANRHRIDSEDGQAHFGVVTAPIVGNSITFGTISFAIDEQVRTIDSWDSAMAEDMCHRIGVMFEMGRLYNDLHTAIDVRDEFLSIAAHELRTPISSVKGYSQLLLRGLERGTLLPERLRLGLRTIESSATRLTTLTSDLLEVSRAGMNRLPLHLESIDAFAYLSGFLEERQALKPDPHEFMLVSDDPGVRINVDVGRLDQVMSNLASNAVKYSPADKPVEFGMWADSDGVAILVRDYGIGLEEGDPDRIFQPFQRSRAAIASNAPGMGLGLFISRNIIERHHGTLTASSDGSGHGSTFRIWLPADSSPQSDS